MQVQLLAACMVLTCACGAFAQSASDQWVNRKLLEKKLPQDRYASIGRGDLSACRSDAARAAQRTGTGPDCDSLQDAPNIFIAQQCSEQQSKAKQAAAQLHRDAFLACMARKGWVLEPVAK